MDSTPQGPQRNDDSPFARELFIQFLTRISVLHESDMEEIEEFRKAIGSEMQAYEHLGEYYEKLGDPDFKENARQTVDSYKVFLRQQDEEQQRNTSGNGQNPIFDSTYSQDKKQQAIPYGSVTSSQFGSPSQDSHQRSTKSSQMQYRQKEQPTGHTNGIHERLFKEAVDKQEYNMLMDQLKHEQEVKECTFVPRINSHSREVSAQRGEKDPVFTRLAERKKMSLHSHANSWTIREDQELQKCTFKPLIHKLKSDSRVCQEQESVFDRLYGGNFLNSEIRKISHRLTANYSNVKETKQFSASKVTTGHFSNSKIIPQDETIITPDKLKNKEDFLKWQNWNQSFENTNDLAPQTMSFSANRPSSNTNNEDVNNHIHWSQQPVKQNDQNQQQHQYQRQYKQESSRSLTPVKKSVSPLRSPDKSNKKDEDHTIFDRLYSLHFTRQNQQLVREIESNYLQQKELTFQPEKFTKSYKSCNSSNSQSTDKDIYTRLYEVSQLQAMKLQGKLQQKETLLLQQLEQAHPQLCKHSMELVQQGRMDNAKEVHERLFQQAMEKPKRNQVLLQKVQNDEGCTFKPLTNSNKKHSQNHSVLLSKNGENEDPFYSNKPSNASGTTPKNSMNPINIEQQQVTPCRLELKPAPQPISISKTPKAQNSSTKSPLNKSALSSCSKTNDTVSFVLKKNSFFS